jgi:cysteine-rich repeat protein
MNHFRRLGIPGVFIGFLAGPPALHATDVTGGGDTCDDGNTTGGDGCSATCQTEP